MIKLVKIGLRAMISDKLKFNTPLLEGEKIKKSMHIKTTVLCAIYDLCWAGKEHRTLQSVIEGQEDFKREC